MSARVSSQLPLRENLRKTIRHQRTKNLPPNQKSLVDLSDIPAAQYQEKLLGKPFLLQDNKNTADEDEDEGRVLVFATRKNIEMLCRSPIWFEDGTFKVSPTIFAQLFTVIRLRQRNHQEVEDTPLLTNFVYALLKGKQRRSAFECWKLSKMGLLVTA